MLPLVTEQKAYVLVEILRTMTWGGGTKMSLAKWLLTCSLKCICVLECMTQTQTVAPVSLPLSFCYIPDAIQDAL